MGPQSRLQGGRHGLRGLGFGDVTSVSQLDLAQQQGVGRGTSYTLAVDADLPELGRADTDEDRIVAYVRQHGSITNPQCRELLGVELPRAWYLLNSLKGRGVLRKEGERRWARYVLP